MSRRPLSVTVISWVFIVLGGLALVAGWLPPAQRLAECWAHPFEFGLVQALRIIEVVSGVFMFSGFNWARWLGHVRHREADRTLIGGGR